MSTRRVKLVNYRIKNNKVFKYTDYCNDPGELEMISNEFDVIVVCDEDSIMGITHLLNVDRIKKLYILISGNEAFYPIEIIDNGIPTIEVSEENKLRRHLYTEAMVNFYEQGLKHRHDGDIGLANRCFQDALDVLDQARSMR